MGLVVETLNEKHVRRVFVLWEDGQRERYSIEDAPKLWSWCA
jgi:hypothetical protein